MTPLCKFLSRQSCWFRRCALTGLLAVPGLPSVGLGAQQWTTNGSNINNSNSGNVGIGTTTPAYKLDVNGGIRASAGRFSGVSLDGSSDFDIYGIGPATTFDIFSEGNMALYAGPGKVLNLGSNGIYAQMVLDNGNLKFGNNATGSHKINVSEKGLLVFNTQAAPETNGAMIGGLGFLGMGASHGQFHYRGGVGFEMIDVSATGPYLDHPSTAWAPLQAGHFIANGNVTATGNIAAKYQDVAEWVPAARTYPAGTVLVLDTERTNHVKASSTAYDTHVAGVVSEMPGLLLGEAGDDKVKVATTGRVKVRVAAGGKPVRVGDLLVTGDTPGTAMVSEPIDINGRAFHQPGTILGKALEPLREGEGDILVLLSLQ